MGAKMIAKIGQPEQVTPGMKGHEIGSDSDQRRGECQEKKKQSGFPPFRLAGAGDEGEQERREQEALEKERGGSGAGTWGHKLNHVPGFRGVEGERADHDPKAPAKTKGKPPPTGRKKQRGIGGAPVPGGQEEKKNGSREGRHFPNEEKEEGEREVDHKEPK